MALWRDRDPQKEPKAEKKGATKTEGKGGETKELMVEMSI